VPSCALETLARSLDELVSRFISAKWSYVGHRHAEHSDFGAAFAALLAAARMNVD
jgi:hypothetical protein